LKKIKQGKVRIKGYPTSQVYRYDEGKLL